MKNQVTITPPKENNKALITDPKEMKIFELTQRIQNPLKKFRKLQ